MSNSGRRDECLYVESTLRSPKRLNDYQITSSRKKNSGLQSNAAAASIPRDVSIRWQMLQSELPANEKCKEYLEVSARILHQKARAYRTKAVQCGLINAAAARLFLFLYNQPL